MTSFQEKYNIYSKWTSRLEKKTLTGCTTEVTEVSNINIMESKISFSCPGIMILKYKNSVHRAQLKLKSGIFCSDPDRTSSATMQI